MCVCLGRESGGGELGRRDRGKDVFGVTEASVLSVDGPALAFLRSVFLNCFLSPLVFFFVVKGWIASPLAKSESMTGQVVMKV